MLLNPLKEAIPEGLRAAGPPENDLKSEIREMFATDVGKHVDEANLGGGGGGGGGDGEFAVFAVGRIQ